MLSEVLMGVRRYRGNYTSGRSLLPFGRHFLRPRGGSFPSTEVRSTLSVCAELTPSGETYECQDMHPPRIPECPSWNWFVVRRVGGKHFRTRAAGRGGGRQFRPHRQLPGEQLKVARGAMIGSIVKLGAASQRT